MLVPPDRLAFLNGPAVTTGVNAIDLWIGGLAEKQMPFGGLLGSTFNYVFENQMEKLQNGDRFYYLERTAGLNFLTELENNSFAKLIMANTNATHLPGDVFSTPAFILEVNDAVQYTGLGDGRDDPTDEDGAALVIRNNPGTEAPDPNYLQYIGEDHVVLGGTNASDTIISSIGDDTLYGDDGDDRLEGGDGVDIIFGGTGDDIITDQGGDDNLQGQDGNDAIHGGNGINLILGGFGNDFIVTGEDESEAFGGPGNDFIFGVRPVEMIFGNEGDDWIEHGMADGSAGENFDVRGLDSIVGNDVFMGDTVSDRMGGEGGDDIMVGNGGTGDRYLGASGFDWAVFQHDTLAANVDMNLRAFDETPVPLSVASTLARFESVEGLSGSKFSDILRGDDADAAVIAASGFTGSVLTNIALIDGLQEFLDTILGAPVTSFGAGNIILGGDGSDIIEGRGGDDLIDGDRWLNVRISVRANPDGSGAELFSVDSMTDLTARVFAGEINPGQLVIVREILPAAAFPEAAQDFDTALFSDVRANYTFSVDDGGTADDFSDDVVTVTHIIDDGGVLVPGPDGTDRLMNIERLQFSDQAVVLAGLNDAPVGLLTISDATPAEEQLLTVSIAGVTDADNVSPSNPTGAITGPVSYVWQVDTRGDGVFEDIIQATGLGDVRATGPTFTPGDAEAGLALRVKALYQDANGVLETVFSAATAAVTNINDAPVGTVAISDASPTETLTLTVSNSFSDADGLDAAVFSYQWQRLDGAVWVNVGADLPQFAPTQAEVGHRLRVIVSYTDDQGTAETVTSAATGPVGDFIPANPAAQSLTGTAFDDLILGGAGGDVIDALAGDDTIDGGTIADLIDAGAGNDTINYTMGQGADTVMGGLGTDRLNIFGGDGNDQLDVVLTAGTISNVENGAISGVEQFTANLGGGTNTLSYGAATTSSVTVNLAAGLTGVATGFVSIAGIQNVTGGAGNDLITGNANANVLSGGNGNDTFFATMGDGNDTMNGGNAGGVDTVDFSATTGGAIITTVGSLGGLATGNDVFTSIENIIGSQGDDTITFNGGINVLDGQGGNDTINAGAANDIVRGGSGNDTLNGEAGADTLDGEEGNDTLIGGAGNDTVDGGDGSDTVMYTIGDGADMVNDTGGSGADTLSIVDNGGGNVLDVTWNGTNLTFEGGTIAGIESVTANMGGGIDRFSYAGSTAGVVVDLGAGTATGFASVAGIENVTGGTGADNLTGDAGANILAGGGGNDIYHVGDGDTVTEAVGGGTDTVFSSATNFTLGVNVENLTIEGAGLNGAGNGVANIISGNGNNNLLTGGGGADTLIGNDGADTLNGDAGNDVLTGGLGDDTMDGGANFDTFVFSSGFGADTINGFDAIGGGTLANQDLLDVSGFVGPNEINAGNFATRVSIDVISGNTVVTIDGNTITLNGVAAGVTQQDFIL